VGKNSNNRQQQIEKISALYQQLITAINEDPKREGLKKTPNRAAAAFQFLTQGYQMKLEDLVRGALFKSDNNEMVVVKEIELFSLCEHHLLPILGKAHVAYLPRGKIIGLSKIPRIVELFARRLQVQENLTTEIAKAVMKVTGSLGVGVVIEAKHLCMIARGVEKQGVTVTTSAMLGAFRKSAKSRHEFLTLLK